MYTDSGNYGTIWVASAHVLMPRAMPATQQCHVVVRRRFKTLLSFKLWFNHKETVNFGFLI